MNQIKPAKKIWVWAILLVGCAAVLGFALVLRHSLRTAVRIDPADYTEPAPAQFSYACTVAPQNGALSFSGYAVVAGERFLDVDTFVVLYSASTDTYWKLPTTMAPDDSLIGLFGDEVNYSFGGYYAFVLEKQLTAPAADYEICFAYRSSGHNALIHTGQKLEAAV